ncbi:alkyl sulfatase dimerization domain-containing protein [Variovorax dokdonensis]|uniref:Alkyl sulfatase dimerization domain-containing protein n=1 Tax=Variovorax dokdonensis TaxID=344883 RepID=A0ABT7NH01_9BURK|nr:alkyl sulfatase dimerization domain-containing protein [Variovorax dokdonensis]MDM0047105.1 alkyl sulfatase dimerization domain-containing protein [Variovorax dokdonensis]
MEQEKRTDATGIGVLLRAQSIRDVVPGVHTLGGQGNTLAVETGLGVVVVDAGPGGQVSRQMIERLRTITDARVYAIVYSHGHAGYNAGVPAWLEHAAARNEAPPILIGHRRVQARYRRYQETAGLQAWLNSRQFRRSYKAAAAANWIAPELAFDDTLVLECADRRIELIAAPSETDDTVALWLQEERFLYGSAAMIRSIPNIGTPLRTLRDPMRWAATLERLHALRPRIVLPEFGQPIIDAQQIEDAFCIPMRALYYLRDEVVARMNQGMGEREILADMRYPSELFGHHFMRAIYGSPDYIVRDIWRSENGWWDRNPTQLHPARPADAAAAILAALGEPASVVAHCRSLAQAGQTQLAMHVIDLIAQAGGDDPVLAEAREFKASLCEERSTQCSSVVSRQILLSCAEDLRGLPIGSTRERDPPMNFSWD